MNRFNIIDKIGKKYLSANIENDEFSYIKAGACEAKGLQYNEK